MPETPPPAMAAGSEPIEAPKVELAATPRSRRPSLRRRRVRTVRYALIEVGIVTAGVLIALGVDEMRTSMQERRLADQARERFRTEIVENRDRALRKMAETEKVFTAVQAAPDQAGVLVRRGENLFMLFFDSAWETAVQTNALAHLDPEEVASLSSTYSGQERYLELQEREQERWQALGAHPEGPLPEAEAEARTGATAQWSSYARGLYQSTCRLVLRFDAALDQPYDRATFDRCRRLDPAAARFGRRVSEAEARAR